MNNNDQQIYDQYLDEVRQNVHNQIVITATLPQVLIYISQLQLALRHPMNTGPSADVTRAMITDLRKQIGDLPAVQEVISRGFDPKYDMQKPQNIADALTARLAEAERLLADAKDGIILSGDKWNVLKQDIAAFLAANPTDVP